MYSGVITYSVITQKKFFTVILLLYLAINYCFGLSQFILHTSGRTWNEAESVCQSNGGSLVRVDSQEKYDLLQHFAQSSPWSAESIRNTAVWIGLHLIDEDEKSFVWTDCSESSSTNGGSNYAYWKSAEPNHLSSKKCVELKSFTKEFQMATCDTSSIFVCENIDQDCDTVDTSCYEAIVFSGSDTVKSNSNNSPETICLPGAIVTTTQSLTKSRTESTTTTEPPTTIPTTKSATTTPTTESSPITESATTIPTTESTTTTEPPTTMPTTESATTTPSTESLTTAESTTIISTTDPATTIPTTESTTTTPTTESSSIATESATTVPTTESTTMIPTTESATTIPTAVSLTATAVESITTITTTESTTTSRTSESLTSELSTTISTTESTTKLLTSESTTIISTTDLTTTKSTTGLATNQFTTTIQSSAETEAKESIISTMTINVTTTSQRYAASTSLAILTNVNSTDSSLTTMSSSIVSSTEMPSPATTSTFTATTYLNQSSTPQGGALNGIGCVCTCIDDGVNITDEVLQNILDTRKRYLTVDKLTLSSAIRKKNSARDSRESSENFGLLAIVLLSCVFGGLVLLDLPRVVTCLKEACNDIMKR